MATQFMWLLLLLVTSLHPRHLLHAFPSESTKSPVLTEDVSSFSATTAVSVSSSHSSNPNHQKVKRTEEDMTPAAYIHLVKKSDFPAWLKSQGPDAIVSRQGSILILHRSKRQGPPPGGGPGGGGGGGGPSVNAPKVVTPVLPITGEKKYNESDCMPWEDVAVILRSSLHPEDKARYIEPKTCNMKEGLECLAFEDRGVTVHRCECMLVYGPSPVYTNYTDNTGRIKKKCFIPAGLGWASECNEKAFNAYGYPLPFGDPSGTNAEQAAQTDAFNQENGEVIVVDYIRWNSVKPLCVPHAICREKGTYRGQRCQCKMGHRLEKPEGKCSGASRIGYVIATALAPVTLVMLQFARLI